MTSTAAQPIGHGPFEAPRGKPFVVGQLRTKVWAAPFTHGVTDIWARRCQEYWDRIEQRFGVVLTDHRNAWDTDPEHGSVIATYAVVLAILPGERYPPRPTEVVQ